MSTEFAAQSDAPTGGAGAILTRARESKGMHISVLATSLRVPVDRIRALESESWDDLPDLVFARALAMSVCRHLKIDAAPVLAGMPDPDPMRSVRVTAAISQPLGGMASTTPSNRKPVLILAVIVLALFVWFFLNPAQEARPTATVEVPEMPPDTPTVTESTTPQTSGTNPEITPDAAAEAEKSVTVPVPNSKP